MVDQISVGHTFGSIKGYEVRLTREYIHLDLPAVGICLNLNPKLAKEIADNLMRACDRFEAGVETGITGRMGLIKLFPPVSIRATSGVTADGRR